MTTQSNSPSPKSILLRKRFLWIIVVIVMALAVIGFESNRRSIETEERHIVSVHALGGRVQRDRALTQFLDGPNFPRFLVPYIQTLGKVNYMTFYRARLRVTDAMVDLSLTYFPEIEVLELTDTEISDALMEKLSELQSLHRLDLSRTLVSDKGIATLSENQNITHLFLDQTKITDESIKHLSKMTRLRSLSCKSTNLTDKSVEIFLQFPQLKFLHLDHTSITEEGWNRLKQKKSLTTTRETMADRRRFLTTGRVIARVLLPPAS